MGDPNFQRCPGEREPEPGPSMVGLVPLAPGMSSALTQPSSGLIALLPMGSNLGRRHRHEGEPCPCMGLLIAGEKANPEVPASLLPGQRRLIQFQFKNSEGTEWRKEWVRLGDLRSS